MGSPLATRMMSLTRGTVLRLVAPRDVLSGVEGLLHVRAAGGGVIGLFGLVAVLRSQAWACT